MTEITKARAIESIGRVLLGVPLGIALHSLPLQLWLTTLLIIVFLCGLDMIFWAKRRINGYSRNN